jgi:hypothetical protein
MSALQLASLGQPVRWWTILGVKGSSLIGSVRVSGRVAQRTHGGGQYRLRCAGAPRGTHATFLLFAARVDVLDSRIR